MSFGQTFVSLASIFFAMLIGFMANRLGYLDSNYNQKLSSLLLKLIMPCTIISSVLTQTELPVLQDIVSILFVALIFYIFCLLCSIIFPKLLRVPKSQEGIFQYALFFSNMEAIGYPVVTALWGIEYIFYVAILALPASILSYTLGISMINRGRNKVHWKMFFSPCTIAALIALIITLLHLHFPVVVTSCISFVGSACFPMGIILLGSIFADLPLRKAIKDLRIWLLTVIRLFAMPTIFYGILYLFGIDSLIRNIAVVIMGMPTAANCAIFALQYDCDTDCAVQAVFFSTVASIFSIPILASWIL